MNGAFGEIEIILDRETGRSCGFAFITFTSADAAEAALSLDGGIWLVVAFVLALLPNALATMMAVVVVVLVETSEYVIIASKWYSCF